MILVICIFYEGSKSDIMDNFDIQILSKLLNNCRESDRQIGIDLGMSGGAVNARIRKMQKLEIIVMQKKSPSSRVNAISVNKNIESILGLSFLYSRI